MVVSHGPSPASPVPVVTTEASADALPVWFVEFLNDRQTRKPSAHTMKAYRQDFFAIAMLVTDGNPSRLTVSDITKDSMRAAFAAFARNHEAASIRRCWSTWNVLCTFLFTSELLTANPMALVGRPKLARSLPKALPRTAVEALLETVAKDVESTRQTDWAERDLAIILTALLAGLRAEELRQADIGDVRTVEDGAGVIHVKGKGGKERTVPVEVALLRVIEVYLDSRAIRFPDAAKRHAKSVRGDLTRWPGRSAPCSLAATASGSHVARYSRELRVPSGLPVLTPSRPLGRWCTDCGTPTLLNWLARTSASTR